MATLIDGKAVSAAVKERVRQTIEANGYNPCLAVIIVGDDPASRVYVNNKKKACEVSGIHSVEYALPQDATQHELLSLIDQLNADADVNGILCQLPLPPQIDEIAVIARIAPLKDVDCFNSLNVGRLWTGDKTFEPCTPAGMIELLDAYGIDPTGKHCVIVGRSNIVGKPMAALMLERDATVTVCHSKTKDLAAITQQADILVASVGNKHFFSADMIKAGAVILDVGITRGEDNKLYGDVDFDAVKDKVSYITPVPGGCGPMTIAVLMKNTLRAYCLQMGKR